MHLHSMHSADNDRTHIAHILRKPRRVKRKQRHTTKSELWPLIGEFLHLTSLQLLTLSIEDRAQVDLATHMHRRRHLDT